MSSETEKELQYVPPNTAFILSDTADLIHCDERNSYVLINGEVVLEYEDGKISDIFNKESEFFNLMFGKAPGDFVNRSHVCYAFQK